MLPDSLNSYSIIFPVAIMYVSASSGYAFPWSGDAFSDRQLAPNFELWAEQIFCVATGDMFPYEDSKILSVCPYPEKRNHPGFVNISPTLVILIHEWKGLHDFSIMSLYCEHWLVLSFYPMTINNFKHSSRSQHAPIWRHRGCIVISSRGRHLVWRVLKCFWENKSP